MANGRFSSPGTFRQDLEQAWQDRLQDAEVLLQQGRTASAIADSVYAVEILLKVLICKKLDLDSLPRAFEIHDLSDLLLLAGLSKQIKDPSLRKTKVIWDEVVAVAKEINDMRYRPSGNWNRRSAAKTVNRIRSRIVPWLTNV
jgi:HEPN domain-containing protein